MTLVLRQDLNADLPRRAAPGEGETHGCLTLATAAPAQIANIVCQVEPELIHLIPTPAPLFRPFLITAFRDRGPTAGRGGAAIALNYIDFPNDG